jgi:HAD superfamily hydrolase (TIGR01549 family)
LDGTLLVSGDGEALRLRLALELAAAGRDCSWWSGASAESPSKEHQATLGAALPLDPLVSAWPPGQAALARSNYVHLCGEARRARGLCALPGAAYLLRLLQQQGYRCFVVTNATQGSAETALEALGLAPWIQRVLGIDPRRPSPKAQRLEQIARELAPDDTLLLGDSASDMEAARQAGLPGLHFCGGGAEPEEGQGAVARLDLLVDLLPLLVARPKRIAALARAIDSQPGPLAVASGARDPHWPARLANWLGRSLMPWESAAVRLWCGPAPRAWPGELPAHWRLGIEDPLDPPFEPMVA